MTDRIKSHLNLIVPLTLIVINLALFWQVQNHGFIDYDVHRYIIDNPNVRSGLTYKGITWAFTSTCEGNWHPLTWLSHMMDCDLYGLNPKGHHLNNLLFHITNTILLFLVLRRMTNALWRSAFVAVLFAIHPLHVESVAWIAERKDVLSTFFWGLTIWAYIRYVERPLVRRYVIILLFFTLGLMSKPMLVTLPFLLILIDYWPLRRFKPPLSRKYDWKDCADSIYIRPGHRYILNLLLEKAPLFALAAVSSIVTFMVQQSWGAVKSLESFPLKVRIANSLVAYAGYLGKTLWPQKLAVLNPHPGDSITILQVFGSGLLLAAITVLVIRMARKHAFLLVGWFWFIGTLFPVIGLVQVGLQGMADRYTYVPIIGIFIIAVWGIPVILKNCRHRKIILAITAGIILLFTSVSTVKQVSYWQNSITLFEHAIDATNDNFIAHYNLGVIHSRLGYLSKAARHYSAALEIDPNSSDANCGLGYTFSQKGNFEKAIHHYHKALKIDADHEKAHNNLGVALVTVGKVKDGIPHFLEAIRISPGYQEAAHNLSVALEETGDKRYELTTPDTP